jgi:hypothetical protein
LESAKLNRAVRTVIDVMASDPTVLIPQSRKRHTLNGVIRDHTVNPEPNGIPARRRAINPRHSARSALDRYVTIRSVTVVYINPVVAVNGKIP